MLERHEHHSKARIFDGIVDNRAQRIPTYFTLLFYGLAAWGVLFCGYYLLSGWSSVGEFEAKQAAFEKVHRKPAAVAPPAAAVSPGEAGKLFAERCVACHGPQGKGGIGPDLTRAEFTYGKSEDKIVESISAGRKGMPPFGNELSPDQIRQVARFVLSLK